MFVCAVIFSANAQFSSNAQPFSRFGAGVNAGTYGAGVWGATNLTDNFMLRVGFSHFGLNLSQEWNETFDGFAIDAPNANVPELGVTIGSPTLRMPHGKLIVDYFPWSNGIFSISFGTYIGAFDLGFSGSIDGYAALYSEHGSIALPIEGVNLVPRPDGTFDGTFRFGNIVKPYLGIGIGRTIPNNRVGFRFDLGVAYQGNIRLISDQANVDLTNLPSGIDDAVDFLDTVQRFTRFWPMMNFSLTIGI